MIPVEAVEAVTDALWKKYSAQGPVDAQRWRTIMEDSKLALEAAAPHLMAEAWEEGRKDGHAEEQCGFDNAMNPYSDPFEP